jgi:hypothetical protein
MPSADRRTRRTGRRDLTGAWHRPNSRVSADRSSSTPSEEGDRDMVVIGVDSHKRTHTVVAVDEAGRKLAERTVATTMEGHLELLGWSHRWPERTWALEDCRHLTRRLELAPCEESLVSGPRRAKSGSSSGSERSGNHGNARSSPYPSQEPDLLVGPVLQHQDLMARVRSGRGSTRGRSSSSPFRSITSRRCRFGPR